jgi:hypothetical protein
VARRPGHSIGGEGFMGDLGAPELLIIPARGGCFLGAKFYPACGRLLEQTERGTVNVAGFIDAENMSSL